MNFELNLVPRDMNRLGRMVNFFCEQFPKNPGSIDKLSITITAWGSWRISEAEEQLLDSNLSVLYAFTNRFSSIKNLDLFIHCQDGYAYDLLSPMPLFISSLRSPGALKSLDLDVINMDDMDDELLSDLVEPLFLCTSLESIVANTSNNNSLIEAFIAFAKEHQSIRKMNLTIPFQEIDPLRKSLEEIFQNVSLTDVELNLEVASEDEVPDISDEPSQDLRYAITNNSNIKNVVVSNGFLEAGEAGLACTTVLVRDVLIPLLSNHYLQKLKFNMDGLFFYDDLLLESFLAIREALRANYSLFEIEFQVSKRDTLAPAKKERLRELDDLATTIVARNQEYFRVIEDKTARRSLDNKQLITLHQSYVSYAAGDAKRYEKYVSQQVSDFLHKFMPRARSNTVAIPEIGKEIGKYLRSNEVHQLTFFTGGVFFRERKCEESASLSNSFATRNRGSVNKRP